MTLSATEFSYLSGYSRAMQELDMSVRQISRKLKVSWSTAKRLVVGERAARKAKRKQSKVAARQREVKKIAKLRRVTPAGLTVPMFCSASAIQAELAERKQIRVTKRTIVRDLNAMGAVPRVRRCVPSLDTAVFEKRVALAKQMVQKTDAELEKFSFGDECKVSFNDHSKRIMWVFPNHRLYDKVIPRERKRRDENVNSFQIYSCIGVGFRHIVCLRPPPSTPYPRGRPRKGEIRPPKPKKTVRLTGDSYIKKCLQPMRRKMRCRVLFHDGARPHTANIVKQFCATSRIRVVQNAPYSPMLNPVENLFPRLHEEISKFHPQTLDELESAVFQAFTGIPQNYIDKLSRSFRGKCEAAIATRGKFF